MIKNSKFIGTALIVSLLVLPALFSSCAYYNTSASASYSSADNLDIRKCEYTTHLKDSSYVDSYLVVYFTISQKSQLFPAIQNNYKDIYITNGIYKLNCGMYVDSYDMQNNETVSALIFSCVDKEKLTGNNALYISYSGKNFAAASGMDLPPIRYADAASESSATVPPSGNITTSPAN